MRLNNELELDLRGINVGNGAGLGIYKHCLAGLQAEIPMESVRNGRVQGPKLSLITKRLRNCPQSSLKYLMC